jgi:hypothetical protein
MFGRIFVDEGINSPILLSMSYNAPCPTTFVACPDQSSSKPAALLLIGQQQAKQAH